MGTEVEEDLKGDLEAPRFHIGISLLENSGRLQSNVHLHQTKGFNFNELNVQFEYVSIDDLKELCHFCGEVSAGTAAVEDWVGNLYISLHGEHILSLTKTK